MMLCRLTGISSVMITGLLPLNVAPIKSRRLGWCTLAAIFISLINRSVLCGEMISPKWSVASRGPDVSNWMLGT